ncbi:MFS transporter [Streptococcus equinus]|uniref:MFS transporter n=1 Tax=Streptococcus equinus TaxID=1335 RepID=UPI003EEE1E75
MRNKRIFYSIVASDILSDFGDTLYYLALMNYVLLLSNSNLALSVITISETLPILFKVFIGHYADRSAKKVEGIIFTQLFRFFLYAVVGVLVSFTPALWIVIVISFINFISDLAGKLENGLYLPIEVQLINDEEREQIFASSQSISSTLNIIFKLSGAALVTWISYQTLAFVNSFTFLACALFMYVIRLKLPIINDGLSDSTQDFENTVSSVKKAINYIRTIPNLSQFLLAISGINGLFSITTPLIVSNMACNKEFILFNSATTISLSGVIVTIASILGNIVSTTFFKKITLKTSVLISSISLPFLFITFVVNNILLCFIVLACLGIFSGMITPKFYGFLMSSFPTEKLGVLTSSIGTVIQLGTIASQVLFSLLIINTSTTTISWIYLSISTLLIIYLQRTLKSNRERKFRERKFYHVFNFKLTKN